MEIPFLSDIMNFLQATWDFIYQGAYDFVKSAFVLLTKMIIYAYFNSMLFLAEVAYQAFKEIIDGLGVSSAVRSHYNSIDGNVRGFLAFLGVPDAFNIIFSAIGTRFTMRFIPFLGR